MSVTEVFADPIEGLKPVIVGIGDEGVTVKDLLLIADPAGAVTIMGPEVVPPFTVAAICDAVAEVRAPSVTLKLTES